MARFAAILAIILANAAVDSAVQAQDRGYPYSIMKPEPGTRDASRRSVTETLKPPRGRVRLQHRAKLRENAAKRLRSTPVLTLPKTEAIPPVAVSPPPRPLSPNPRPDTVVPGYGSVPNLPPTTPRETFQDRAARCSHQMGVYNVPGNQATTYMGACAN